MEPEQVVEEVESEQVVEPVEVQSDPALPELKSADQLITEEDRFKRQQIDNAIKDIIKNNPRCNEYMAEMCYLFCVNNPQLAEDIKDGKVKLPSGVDRTQPFRSQEEVQSERKVFQEELLKLMSEYSKE